MLRLHSILAGIIGLALVAAPAIGQSRDRQIQQEKDPRFARQWEQTAVTFQSKYYMVRSDLDPGITRTLAAHMDRMCDEYAGMLSGLRIRPGQRRLQLFLFRQRPSYLSVMKLRFHNDAEGTVGLAVRDGTEITLAAWQGSTSETALRKTLQHEGFHQFKELYFPSMPPWVNEGLAEIFESAVVLADGIVLGEVSRERLEILRRADRRNGLIPFDKLFDADADDWLDHVNEGGGNLEYAESWSVVHFLIFGEGQRFRPSFERFLVMMNQGRAWQASFQQAFGTRDLRRFSDRWYAYLKQQDATDFEETILRLEFIGAGLIHLAAKDEYPESIEMLAKTLEAAEFRYQTEQFGIERTLTADKPANFTVPGSGRRGRDASFILAPSKLRGEKVPRHSVHTEGLTPLGFGVGWTERGGKLRWQLRSSLESRK